MTMHHTVADSHTALTALARVGVKFHLGLYLPIGFSKLSGPFSVLQPGCVLPLQAAKKRLVEQFLSATRKTIGAERLGYSILNVELLRKLNIQYSRSFGGKSSE